MLLEKHRKVLLRSIDSDNCYFLSCLVSEGILSREHEQIIKAEKTQLLKNQKIIELLFECPSSEIKKFVNVLRTTEQEHVANLLSSEDGIITVTTVLKFDVFKFNIQIL